MLKTSFSQTKKINFQKILFEISSFPIVIVHVVLINNLNKICPCIIMEYSHCTTENIVSKHVQFIFLLNFKQAAESGTLWKTASSIYEFSAKSIDGDEVSLEKYRYNDYEPLVYTIMLVIVTLEWKYYFSFFYLYIHT